MYLHSDFEVEESGSLSHNFKHADNLAFNSRMYHKSNSVKSMQYVSKISADILFMVHALSVLVTLSWKSYLMSKRGWLREYV